MKNILLIAATWLMVLTGCSKEISGPQEEESLTTMSSKDNDVVDGARATVEWTADPAVDGLGWVLRVDKVGTEVPKSIPEQFMKNGTEVIVSYKRTNERVPCRCAEPIYYVEITSIKLANP